MSSCQKFLQYLETCLLTAEADRGLCHVVMFLTAFSTGCTQGNTAAIKILLLWPVCLLGFWLRNTPVVKVIGDSISDGIVFVVHLA